MAQLVSTFSHYAKCHYTECRCANYNGSFIMDKWVNYDECRYTECRLANYRISFTLEVRRLKTYGDQQVSQADIDV